MEDNFYSNKRYEIRSGLPTSINFPLPSEDDNIAYDISILVSRTVAGSECIKYYKLVILKSSLNTPENLATVISDIQQKTAGTDINLTFTGTTVNGKPNLNIVPTNVTTGFVNVMCKRIMNLS